jgi:uncharacterized protein YecE (DUF72 family)
MTTEITVGICGFARSQASVFAQLPLLEVQATFYRPVKRATAESWRQRAPQEFEFTLKAWQLITHEPSSPTYRKARVDIPAEKAALYGCFKPTEEVAEAWAVTNEIREALDAKVVVFQTPPRFAETAENISNLRQFFRTIARERKGISMVWEARGRWDRRTLAKLCEELDLVHAVDPFAAEPVTPGVAYFRLHGKPPGNRMYRYTYTDADLQQLYEQCLRTGGPRVYVLFNNETMYVDALRFTQLISQ